MSKIIGIDLGTTNSVVAVMQGGEPVVIPNQEGARTTPSVVGITKSGERLVGQVAKRQSITNPENTVYSIKRFMGRRYDEVGEELKRVPYKIVRGPHDDVRVEISGKVYSPPEISAMILQKLKSAAEDFLGEKVTKAVITVPAYFNDAQRQATKDAGRLAGLEVLRLVNEPTAAALAYGLHKQRRGRVAVYDFGGGTFDISILKLISTADGDIYQVLATNGDTHLGGDDIDNALSVMVRGEIQKKYSVEFERHPEAVQELRKTIIHAKHMLSNAERATIRFALSDDRIYSRQITRAEFDAMIAPILARTMAPVKMALADAKMQPSEMDEVVLVGGSTRIPLVRQTVGDYFGRAPHCELNPDEVVALGAAVQADILESGVKNMLLLDVTPLSLGIETMGGVVAKLIPRNSTIPASAQELFTTGVDNQTGIDIHILQGERELAADCRSLARFQLKVPPGPAGLARVEVKFLIDASGILQVAARDLRTGEQSTLDVQPSYGLTDSEMERMLEESIEFAEQDFEQRQLIEARNEAEIILRATEKALSGAHAAGLSREERAVIDQSVTALREADAGKDYKLIRTRIDELNQATLNLAELTMNRVLQAAVGGKRIDEI